MPNFQRKNIKEEIAKASVVAAITDEIAPKTLVNAEKPTEPEFYCVVRGTKNGWSFNIKCDDPDICSYDSWGDCTLEPYGYITRTYDVCSEGSARVAARRFLRDYIDSYKRCKVKFDVKLED